MNKDDLHRLVNELPEESVAAAATWLERAKDPLLAVLDVAPFDDEPLTAEELADIEAAREEVRRGETVPIESLLGDIEETA